MDKLTIVTPIHFGRERHGKRRLLVGHTPEPPAEAEQGNVPRLTRLMALAIHLEGLLERGEVKDLAEIARLGHITRARVTQIMNLRLLAPEIQEALLDLPNTTRGRDRLLYKHIQALTVMPSWKMQRERWRKMESEQVGRL